MSIDVYKEWLGIPEGPRPPDHYQLLRLVKFEDAVEKIRKNYKKLNAHVRKYATGKYSEQSQALLNEIAKAMLCLTDDELKKEYDRSLGRVVDDRDASGKRPMTAYLQDENLITADQAREAIAHADRTGLTVRDAVVQMKLVDGETAARAFASELGRSYVDLSDLIPDNDAMDTLPKTVVRRHNCLPLFIEDNVIVVACVHEPDSELEDKIRLRFGRPIRPVIASGKAINQAITANYAEGLRKEAPEPMKSVGKGNSKSDLAKVQTKTSNAKDTTTPLTDEEKLQRRQIGMILMCWSIIGPVLLDTFVLWPRFYRFYLPAFFGNFPCVTSILIGVPAAGFFYMAYVYQRK